MAKKKRPAKKTGPVKKKASKPAKGAPDSEQDPKRRLGDFTGKGEHARQGGRKGIVGQTSKKFKTDKKK